MRSIEDCDELIYEEGLSNCCGAGVYANTDICSDCKDHCEIEEEFYE